MKNFMMLLTTHSINFSVVILLFIAITPILARRFTAKGLYYSWLVVVIGLIIPFWPQLDTAAIADSGVKVQAGAILSNPLLTIPALPVNTVAQVNDTVVRPAMANIQWWQFIAVIWAVGAIIVFTDHCAKHYRFVKITDRWSEEVSDERIMALMQGIKEDLGITGPIGLRFCQHVGSPMMIGLFKPRILLPAADFSQKELRFILKHELVHYKRKDLWYKYLLLIATAMHWFNPIVYLMARAVNIQCELSCDAEVVRSSDADARYQYCETIVGLLKTQSKLKTALSTNFYGGKNGMKNRISSILDTRKKKIGLSVISAMLIITTAVGVASATANADSTSSGLTGELNSDVTIRIRDMHNVQEDCTSAQYVDPRPELEFYIEGDNIAQIEVSCRNEYVYAVDWTETQHEKYWNSDYYQTYDEETRTNTFYPERLYDKSMKLVFDEGFSDYGDIWYRWTARNLYQWAAEDNFSHFIGYGIEPKIELTDDMTEEQKLKLAAGENDSGAISLGHIYLEGYPEELRKDRITIKITDREGNTVTKYIDIEISNNEFNQTVVTASVVS